MTRVGIELLGQLKMQPTTILIILLIILFILKWNPDLPESGFQIILLMILILRKLGILEMVLCIQAIVIGVCGGAVSFYTAIKYIQ